MDIEKLINKITPNDKALTELALSGEMDGKEIVRLSLLLKNAGFGGVLLHANAGLKTKYLGSEWLENIKEIEKSLQKNGIKTIIADEDRRPAGSSFATDKKYRAKSLTFRIIPASDFSKIKTTIVGAYGIKMINEDGVDRLEYYYKVNSQDDIKNNDSVMVVFVKENDKSEYLNGNTCLDTLNKEATNHYLSNLYSLYKDLIGEKHKKEKFALFTSEPIRGPMFSPMFSGKDWAICCPYTYDTFDEFESRFEYNILTRLPELFFLKSGEDYSIVTAQYCEVISNQFVTSFVKPYYEWCKKNKITLYGLFAGEETLASQTMLTGSVMYCYRYCDIPGIDIPYLSDKYWAIIKQLTSVMRQEGKENCFALNYGGTGWNSSFNSIKNAGDIQTFLGIDTRINSKATITMQGVAKRDYPSAVTMQSVFMDEYEYVEKYFSRLSILNKNTIEDEHILVVHPLLSAWGMNVAGSCEDKNKKAYKKLEEKFEKTYSFLVRNSIDFDYGDELIMAEKAKVSKENGKASIEIGECKYSTMLISGLETIRKSTLSLISNFVEKGGKVVFVGDMPKRVNGYKTDLNKFRFISKCDKVDKFSPTLVPMLSPKPFAKVEEEGKDKNICIKKRSFADGTILLYALNLNKDKKVDSRIEIDGTYDIKRIDVREGILQDIKSNTCNGKQIIEFSFNEGEELLLSLVKTSKAKKVSDKNTTATDSSFEKVEFNGEFDYKLSEPNVIVLDTAQYRVDGEDRGEAYVLHIEQELRSEFALFSREGIQPYKREELGIKTKADICEVDFTFTFEVKEKPNKLQLVIEEPDRYVINVNKRRLPITKVGDYIDKNLEKIALPTTYLVEGENEITLSFTMTDDMPIEPIYLVGDFGVKIIKKDEGDINQIVALPEKLKPGDITKQGLPYYGGKIYYYLSLEKGYYKMSFSNAKNFAYAKIRSADKEKLIAFAPYITEKKVGLAERDYKRKESSTREEVYEMKEVEGVQIEVGLNRRNTFGPHHFRFRTNEYADPFVFAPDSENYNKKKLLSKNGIIDLQIEKLVKNNEKHN